MNEEGVKAFELKKIVVPSFKFYNPLLNLVGGMAIFKHVKLWVENDDAITPDNFYEYPYQLPLSEYDKLTFSAATSLCDDYKYRRAHGRRVILEPDVISELESLLSKSILYLNDELSNKIAILSSRRYKIISSDEEAQRIELLQSLQDKFIDFTHIYIMGNNDGNNWIHEDE